MKFYATLSLFVTQALALSLVPRQSSCSFFIDCDYPYPAYLTEIASYACNGHPELRAHCTMATDPPSLQCSLIV
ncbi:hypothetical protein NMY22_g12615 [Coprinellus aureogranulatus]|nr:hypothetical protein NMY22_g12615 [Coprinellus aureogranulatus]